MEVIWKMSQAEQCLNALAGIGWFGLTIGGVEMTVDPERLNALAGIGWFGHFSLDDTIIKNEVLMPSRALGGLDRGLDQRHRRRSMRVLMPSRALGGLDQSNGIH